MAYMAFLDPNKPCFLTVLYLLPIENLHNDRTLFDGDKNLCFLYISLLPSNAFESVTSSAYSRSPPTGIP